MDVRIKRLHEDAVIPTYKHDGDSGFDLVATEDVIVEPGETVKVPTGLAFAIPNGYELQIRPRSGITSKTKLRVQFGTVDSPYRGEVSVTVDNLMPENDDHNYYSEVLTVNGDLIHASYCETMGSYIIRKGDRIAQGVIAPVVKAKFTESDTLDETTRGEGGFGSTGVSE